MVEVLDLARLQFAVTTSFHFLFVIVTLGLAPFVAFMQTRYAITGKPVHERMTKFWGQIYVINYAVGIITGLLLEFQFGMNWTGLTAYTGNIFGAPLAMETLVAFFLDSTFLGMWIFGWGRLPKFVHLLLFYLVTITAYVSAFWIIVANGYMQHPVGDVVENGAARLADLSALLTNPNALAALKHVIAAALLIGGYLIAGVSAWHLRRGTGDRDVHGRALRLGLLVAFFASWTTSIMGFQQVDLVARTQPGKIAVINPGKVQELGLPPGDVSAGTAPAWIKGFFDWMLTVGEIYQYVGLIFVLMLIGKFIERRKLVLRLLTWLIPIPFTAVVAGWLVREVGRQPWAVYGRLKTEDAVAPLSFGPVLASLVLFTLLYVVAVGTDWFLIARYARRGPDGSVLGRTLADTEKRDRSDEAVTPAF
ncbi:cytochrome ubiquinol oxidase subunit I [Sphaerisporangium rufum]|uniref:Cytochrome ubiquinol oxidase subunit I n=1 Tax=Sphaerisporangium rufum TaxID=1381558 RepID=A0A919R780_9ACTN|nr:cytochrome ubiquinol oxidase subunit I [Sphaerisporangium rufum]GII80961.1 cytochrome ubiquinol oxidase subunit I [Sphaerisporangium rufum]